MSLYLSKSKSIRFIAVSSYRSLRLLFLSLFFFFLLTQAHAQLSQKNASDIKKTVQSQLAAFATDDAVLAFSYAAPGIQKVFKTADNFIAVVRRTYPVIYRPANILFLEAEILDAVTVQPVRFWDFEGNSWLAAYDLEQQSDGRWLITGCILMRDKSAVDLTTINLNSHTVSFNNSIGFQSFYKS
jgi:Domain of unknown function (DUF4864)